MKQIDPNKELQSQLLDSDGPVCLIIKAQLKPVGELDRFQPAGFPEIGHVIFDAPREGDRTQKVCIVDSPASMANHLEALCLAGTTDTSVHPDLEGLPYVVCVTDSERDSARKDRAVVTSLAEGHRIASDYFLHAKPMQNDQPSQETFREILRKEFKIIEVKKDKTYFIPPETWWSIYQTIFKYDPNSLVHGVFFAREQIRISRFLTAHLEAFGASRVGRSGVKFDRLGKTVSGQPIFAVDEETAREIRATFILDLALLRSYGRKHNGLREVQKRLLLELALWKVARLLERPFRYRSGCHLGCASVAFSTDDQAEPLKNGKFVVAPDGNINVANCQDKDEATADVKENHPGSASKQKNNTTQWKIDIKSSISHCNFTGASVTQVYYPACELFKPPKEEEGTEGAAEEEAVEEQETEE